MTEALYMMPSGKFPMNASGNPTGITRSMFESCCCCCCYCEVSGLQYPNINGWGNCHFEGNILKNTFTFEDSVECGGTNSNIQFGTCTFTITFESSRTLTYTVSGNVETADPDYDYGLIIRDGIIWGLIYSTQADGGCTMENKTHIFTETVPAGTHTFEFMVDTVDGEWHQNMVHHFEIDFGNEENN